MGKKVRKLGRGERKGSEKERERLWKRCAMTQYSRSLGAEGVLPGRQIESLLRVFKQFTLNLPRGELWAHSQFTHHFDLDGISEHIESKFWKNPSKNAVSHWLIILSINQVGSFSMCPPCAWATHWEFFHKIPSNLTTMCPEGSFKTFQKKPSMWFSFTTNSQRTH